MQLIHQNLSRMNLPRYELKAEKSLIIFEFISDGIKGQIPKIIKFDETTLKDVYNLAFGYKDSETGEIDDKVVSNNGDSEQVLATVVAAVYAFTDKYKDVWVYATGINMARTRLYQMGISKYLNEIKHDFNVFGLLDGEWHKYQLNTNYTAFLVKRKEKLSKHTTL